MREYILEQPDQILSLPRLALKYGTISKEQYIHLNKLYELKQKKGDTVDFTQLILTQKFATQYQIELLKLIQGYLVIKKQGEEFGKIAIAKGIATQEDIERALEHQKKQFKQIRIKKLIGDILVESSVITVKQKNLILKEQTFFDNQAKKILTPENEDLNEDPVNLSKYEKQFLQIKVLDQEFAATVIEKGLASEQETRIAQQTQEEEFEKENNIRILGDIMIELGFLTKEQNNLVLKEMEQVAGQEKQTNQERDPLSLIDVKLNHNKMEARVVINEKNSDITLKDIKKALHDKGIKYGIYPDNILQCYLDQDYLDQENLEFIAAKQDFPLNMLKTRQVSFYFNTNKIDSEIKKKGQALAEQHTRNITYVKKDLLGNNIEQPTGYSFALRCATGARLSKDKKKVFAGKTGYPCLSIEKKMFIHPVINVLEDADLRYGSLERFATLNVSGILTGAYPVRAGDVNAIEIRGANIEAMGHVKSQIGITNCVIKTQGDVYARYIHNSRIETFGNVYVKNEIIDSQVFCSGKIDSGQCRVITSTLYGKKGVELAGAGSDKTNACVIGAGTEHHILEKAKSINLKINIIRKKIDDLHEKKREQEFLAKKTFQKMVELKIFHDRAKLKRQKLKKEFQSQKHSMQKEKIKNIAVLINNFKKRMTSSVLSLKKLNKTKHAHDNESIKLAKRIQKFEPIVNRRVLDLQTDLFAFFEWARQQKNNPCIKINGKIFAGTVLKGVFSLLEVGEDKTHINIAEKLDSQNNFYMKKV